MRRYLVPAVVVATVLIILGGYLLGRGEPDVSYRLAKLEVGPIVSSVSAAGSVELSDSLPIVAQSAGVVTDSLADYNAQVKAGDLLASIDPTAANARLSTARADVDVARGAVEMASSQIELARRQMDNARAALASARATTNSSGISMSDAETDLALKRQLMASKDASPAEGKRAQSVRGRAAADLAAARARETAAEASYKASESQIQVSEAQLSNARAALAAREIAQAQAESDVEHTSVRAPVDGIVMGKNVVVGKAVNIGEVLYTIAEDPSKIDILAAVDEADIARVRPEQTVHFRVNAYPETVFVGKVGSVQRMAKVAEGVVVYNVVIDADNPQAKLLPSMTAQVYIILASRDNAVKIPRAALRFVPSSMPPEKSPGAAPVGGETVWRLVGGRPEPTSVKTGITDGVFSELVEGDLKSGEDVIVGEVKKDGNHSNSALSF